MFSLTAAFINYNLPSLADRGYRLLFFNKEGGHNETQVPLGGVQALLVNPDRNRCEVMVFFKWKSDAVEEMEQALISLRRRLEALRQSEGYQKISCLVNLVLEQGVLGMAGTELIQAKVRKYDKLSIGFTIVLFPQKRVITSPLTSDFNTVDIYFPVENELIPEEINPLLGKNVKPRTRAYSQKPWAVYILILFNIIIYGLAFIPDMIRYNQLGALTGYQIWQGEYWRLISNVGLHMGISHLIGNSLALYLFGTKVEEYFGVWRMLGIYCLAGVWGSIFGVFWHPLTPSLGASGAIFGLAGALFYIAFRHKEVFKISVIYFGLFAVISLIQGALSPMVSTAAHLGGFLGGFCAATCLGVLGDRMNINTGLKNVAMILITLAMMIYIVRPPVGGINGICWRAYHLASENRYEEATDLLRKAKETAEKEYLEEIGSLNALIEVRWGDHCFQAKEYEKAAEYYQSALKSEKIFSPRVLRQLARIYEFLNETELAEAWAQAADQLEMELFLAINFND